MIENTLSEIPRQKIEPNGDSTIRLVPGKNSCHNTYQTTEYALCNIQMMNDSSVVVGHHPFEVFVKSGAVPYANDGFKISFSACAVCGA